MNFISEILCRVRTKSPALFVKLQWISGVLAALAFIIQKIISDHVWAPVYGDKLSTVAGYFITAGITMFAVSSLPTADKSTGDVRVMDDIVGGRPDDRNPPSNPPPKQPVG